MKWNIRHTCGLIFLGLCAAVFLFLHQFTVSQEAMQYIQWQSSVHILADGTEEEVTFDEYSAAPVASDGSSYRFSTVLPAGLTGGYLFFETSGLDITLWLGATEIYSSKLVLPEEVLAIAQAHVPLPEDTAGCQLTMLCHMLDGNAFFPPLLRFTTDALAEADTIAYANLSGIPAGAYGISFVLICGLFLLGIVWKKPDWSLIPLALASGSLMAYTLANACGYFYLPDSLNNIFNWDGLALIILLTLAVYLLMNRRRDFWRFFGWATLGSSMLLLVFYLISLCRDGYLSGYINSELATLFQSGLYSGLTYWLTFWLVIVCTMISAYALMRSIAKVQSDAKTLALREQLALDNYRLMEQKLRETAALRHETNHQLTALYALYRQGALEELGRELERFTSLAITKKPVTFTQNFTINAILQNAAAQAEAAGIHFEAIALTPQSVPLPENDLCSFLMNMLDNALEASQNVEDQTRRFIRFRVELSGNFLAFRCENSCQGPLKLDAAGQPQTTKTEPEIHGFGLQKMREIAEKYGSILDFSCSDQSFTVQTALCLPESTAPEPENTGKK